jgi:hypothetical protein
VVNNIDTPYYKLAKFALELLNNFIELRDKFNANNSIFANKFKKFELKPAYKFMTVDIKGLYVNIQINESIKYTKAYMKANNIDRLKIQYMITMLNTILRQNYF